VIENNLIYGYTSLRTPLPENETAGFLTIVLLLKKLNSGQSPPKNGVS